MQGLRDDFDKNLNISLCVMAIVFPGRQERHSRDSHYNSQFPLQVLSIS